MHTQKVPCCWEGFELPKLPLPSSAPCTYHITKATEFTIIQYLPVKRSEV